MLAAACVALVSIGVFHKNIRPLHFMASVAFFTLLPISLLTIAGAFWRAHRNATSLFTLLIALVVTAPWILQISFHYVSGVAIPEFISGLAGAVWIAVLGSKNDWERFTFTKHLPFAFVKRSISYFERLRTSS